MTKDIANILRSSLQIYKDSLIISDLHGLVRTLEYKPADGEKSKKIPFPVSAQEPDNCVECESLFVCVPDKSKRCLVYFECSDASVDFQAQNSTRYKSNFSLICWYNLEFYQPDPLLQSKLISLFSGRIKGINYSNSFLSFSYPEVQKVVENDPIIFSKYTYELSKSQFVGFNFSCFKIDFQIKYNLNEDTNCDNGSVVVINPTLC